MLSESLIIVVPDVPVLTPEVYSLPPTWVPSAVIENLNGWAVGWINV